MVGRPPIVNVTSIHGPVTFAGLPPYTDITVTVLVGNDANLNSTKKIVNVTQPVGE